MSSSVASGEVDLSAGQLQVPEAVALTVEPGRKHDLRVRLPGLAEGTIAVRRQGTNFRTVGNGTAIRLSHPALAPVADLIPTVLVVTVRDNVVGGWVSVGQPGPVRGNPRALVDTMLRSVNALGCAGMTNFVVPSVANEFSAGRINVAVENLGFRLGGYLEGTGSIRLDNQGLAIEGSARVNVPGGSSGELRVRRGADGQLSGTLQINVAIGPASGSVVATLEQGFVHIQGTVGYRTQRMSGSLTLIATDERTARDLTTRTDLDPNQTPVQPPSTEHPARPGRRAFCGWGELDINLTPWLSGRARVIVNNQAQATIIGEIRPQSELILFREREWNRRLFRVEIRAGYGVPVVGQVFVFAAIALEALARVGPGRIHNMSVTGQFSTDPRVENLFTIQGSLNISAFAGLRLRAEGGVGLTLLGHDIRAGVGLNALAGIRGYVDATPSIGRRHREGGRPEWFIHGHLEIAAQPFLGFSGDLFVEIDAPWWSPCPDRRWTWPLFSLEYPLPGQFGIGADVDYVLGSNTWPTISFGAVDFDSSKFMTDLLHDNVPRGRNGEQRRPGSWREGARGEAPSGARNPGGRARQGDEHVDNVSEPVGESISFAAEGESHRLWFAERGPDATLMAASEPDRIEASLRVRERRLPELLPEHQAELPRLLADIRQQLPTLDNDADRIAAMKVATRNARAAFQRHGRGPRRPRGNRPSVREANVRLKAAQRQIVRKLTRVYTLTARQAFSAIERSPPMHGGHETVSIVELGGHAAINISRSSAPWLEVGPVFRLLLVGPASAAHSRAAYSLLQDVHRIMRELDRVMRRIPVPTRQINRLTYRWLIGQARALGGPISRIGQTMRIPNLDRARRIEPLPHPYTISFPPFLPEKEPREPRYRQSFLVEMRRQLRIQQMGANRNTVDQWFYQLALFRMNDEVWAELDLPARNAVLAELQRRAQAALTRVDETLRQLDDRVERILGNRELFGRLGDTITRRYRAGMRREGILAAIAELERARNEAEAPLPELLRPSYPGRPRRQPDGTIAMISEEMALRILGRQHGERRVGYQVRSTTRERPVSVLQQLLPRVRDWAGLRMTARGRNGLAVLHNPDQVFGGRDYFPRLPTAPTGEDSAAWERYCQQMLLFVGSARVNSRIGQLWTRQVRTDAFNHVRIQVGSQEAWPINRLNFRLTPS